MMYVVINVTDALSDIDVDIASDLIMLSKC